VSKAFNEVLLKTFKGISTKYFGLNQGKSTNLTGAAASNALFGKFSSFWENFGFNWGNFLSFGDIIHGLFN